MRAAPIWRGFAGLLLALAATPALALSVSLSAPAAGAMLVPGSNVTVSATATPRSGRPITKVEFFAGTTLIGTDTSSPYSISWANVQPGTYSLTAKATDSTGATATSAARSVRVNRLPSVSLTAPANGANFAPGSTIALSATATDADGTVTKVQFFRGGTTLIGTDTGSPYRFNWRSVPAGSYSLTAKATDNNSGVSTSTTINITVDKPPTVSLSAPANGAVFLPGASITLSANATDAGGSVAKVEFFAGSTLIGTDTTSPYSIAWANPPQGTHTISAKATDNQGVATTSAAVTIRVDASPGVSITAPANNAVFAAPASITINATATDSGGTVAKVDFYQGTTLLGTSTSAPYGFTWTSVAPGSYSLTAVATDNQGGTSTSAPVSVTVNANAAPTVSLTNPAAGASFTAPANITLSANASDPEGSVASVAFYYGTTLIATRTAPPYSFTWTGVPQGSYVLTAVATDNLGTSATSAPVSITVNSAVAQGYYIHVDHVNSPRRIYDQAQVLVWSWDQQEPFGDTPANENPSGFGTFEFPVRMEGRTYFDRETNLLYNTNRYRDTNGGRFIQADPLGLKGGDLSLYVLTRNNPLSFTDPLGLTVWLCNRQVVWYLGGVGNHSYFWNDQNKQCCGRNQGYDPLTSCKERGPGGDACVPITGSQGKEDEIMKCCQQTANQGKFRPPTNDCHVSVDRCLKDVGLPNPGAPGGRTGSCSSCWLSDTPAPSIDYTAP